MENFKEAAVWFHAAKQKHPGDARALFLLPASHSRSLETSASAACGTQRGCPTAAEPSRIPNLSSQCPCAAEPQESGQERRGWIWIVDGFPGHFQQMTCSFLGEVYYRLEMNDVALQVLDALSKRQDIHYGR